MLYDSQRGILWRAFVWVSWCLLGMACSDHALPVEQVAEEAPRVASLPKQPAQQTAPASADWTAEVQQRMANGERAIRADGANVFRVTNRKQGLTAKVDSSGGLHVEPRTGGGSAVHLELASVGREGATQPVGVTSVGLGACASDGVVDEMGACLKRLEVQRAGGVVEWWESRENGLEQGFVIDHRLEGRGLLELRVAVDGAQVEVDGEHASSATLRVDEQTAWSYAGLSVVDARGKTLESWMERDDAGGIRILVDDEEAAYPVVVDPVLSTAANWTAESDQAYAKFGSSIASAGDVNGDGYGDVIVGAWGYENGEQGEGRAFVYLGSASGLATTADWTAESNQINAYFGYSVASAGDVNGDGYSDVIVGAIWYNNGQSKEGRAFVYLGSANGLLDPVTNPPWTAESNQIDAEFGWSVASAGDVNGDGYSDVIVGAYKYDNGLTDEGRVYVYLGSANGLQAMAVWTAESNQADAVFGYSVASAGDVNGDGYSDVIVGAYKYDNGETDEGRAFVYLGSASGLAPTAAWTAESNQEDAEFGHSVASAGDVNGDGYSDVIIGAYKYDNGQSNEGRAYVYLGSANGLLDPATNPPWTAESNQLSPEFGRSVASAGDVNGDGYGDVIVGAPRYDNGESSKGRAFVYLGSASGLLTAATWTAESDQNYPDFGSSVASAGDVNGDGFGDVIVGASFYDNGQPDEGSAFVYLGAASDFGTSAVWSTESNHVAAYLGTSVASAGDVNGDGFGDVIVGAPYYYNGQNRYGRVYVYLGSASGLQTATPWIAESDQIGQHANFGHSVASAGDVNGDGFGDVIVGAYGYGIGGRVYVYLGGANGLQAMASWTAESNQVGATFGWSVASAGDVNGDGFGDVIVGAHQYDNGQTDQGRAFVYLGSANGLLDPVTNPPWTAESNQQDAYFGISVASAGDVNGDGFGDVIVGAGGYDNGQLGEGRVYVYLGSASGLAPTADWTAESDHTDAVFGYSVASAGDVNGDGYGDIIVGARFYGGGEGRAYVYLGSATGLLDPTTNPPWTAESNQPGAYFGESVASAGDVNGDGFGDVIIGAYGYERVYVFLGSLSGLGTSASWIAKLIPGGRFGESVASAGDVNGDGFCDVIVGAPWYTNVQTYEGAAFLYSIPSAGRPNLRLSDPGANRPLAPWNALIGSSVRARAVGATPFGRLNVKAEVEAKPLGVAFNGQGTMLSPNWSPGFSGGAFQELVTDVSLAQAKPHHLRWRLRYRPSEGRPAVASRWIYAPPSGDARGVHFRFGVCGNGLLDGDEACDDDNVATGDGCNAACKWENGIACTPNAASSCATGFCVDGVCCNSACNGSCRACSAQLKGSGNDGECGNFAPGTDPENECTMKAQSTCQQDGQCDGNGACRLWISGTLCGSNACAGNVSKLATCDGLGTCLLDLVGTDCGANGCDPATGQCITGCTADTDCTADAYCDVSSGQCKPKATLGNACAAPEQCQSGHCADGVCCNEACDGTCQACNANGICGIVAADTACAPDPMKPCGFTGVCTDAGACAFAVAGTDCAPPSCTNGMAQSSSCDGSGKCVVTTTTPCGDYQCDATTCKTTCTVDQDCIASAFCENGQCKPKTIVNCPSDCKGPCETGVCTAAGTCELKPAGQSCGAPTCTNGYQSGKPICDDKGACAINTSTAVDCFPYQCSEDASSCKTSCSTNSDCFGGHTCRNGICSTSSCETQPCLEGETCDPATKTCIAATTIAPTCTCQTPGSSDANGRWAITPLALALLMLRRNRTVAFRRGAHP